MFYIFLVVIIAAALAAAFFYVSKIISLPPQGRAIDYINIKSKKNQRMIAALAIH